MDVKKINELFQQELVVINMGLEIFAENLKAEQIKVLPMNWRPPAGGDGKRLKLLSRLGR